MATLNISVPDDLVFFVAKQAESKGFGSSDEYVCDLIRAQARTESAHTLRQLIKDGLDSGPSVLVTKDSFDQLRLRVSEQLPA
jgi:antitoxin ParD1/3/4